MENKIKILISEDESEHYEKALSGMGFEVLSVPKNGRELFDNIILKKPDVVLSCTFLPQMDLVSVISAVKEKSPERSPLFIAIISSESALLEKELIEERGRLELPGRPLLYGTTKNFLRCFSLSDLSELPPLPKEPAMSNDIGEQLEIEESTPIFSAE